MYPQLKPEIKSDLEEFQKYLEVNRYSRSPIQSYKSVLIKFFSFHGGKSPAHIQIKDIERFNHHYIMKKNQSAAFQNQLISAIKKFYETCYNVNLVIGEIERPRKC